MSRANCAARAPEDTAPFTAPFMGGEVSPRRIHPHMTGGYARHGGHAGPLRERIDGGTAA